jgi:hypothetical protein
MENKKKIANQKINEVVDVVRTNPYISKMTKKVSTLSFGSNEIREFEPSKDELNFSMMDNLVLEDYDRTDEEKDSSINIPPPIERTSNTSNSSPLPNEAIITSNLTSINSITQAHASNRKKERSKNTSYIRSEMVDVGGDGNCAYLTISDQVLGNTSYHLALRAATANELVTNHYDYDNDQMLIGDEVVTSSVEQYAKRVARPNEFAGHVEVQALARILNHSIKIYDISGDPNRTRIIDAYDNDLLRFFGDNYYEVVYDSKNEHYLSLHSDNYKARRASFRINFKDVKPGKAFTGMNFCFTGRNKEEFAKLVVLKGGKIQD